jgi:hypothetical protein
MPKKKKQIPKQMKPVTKICFCDSELQYNIPKGVKDSKKVSEKEVFGKIKKSKKSKKD